MEYIKLCKRVAKKCNVVYADARTVIDTLFEEIRGCLTDGDNVAIKNFGVFKTKLVGPRECRNPATGEKIISKPKYRVRFKPGSLFKDELVESGIKRYEQQKN